MNTENKSTDNAPHFYGHRERLRKKFLVSADSLANYELLELLLTYSIPRKDVKPLAKQLLTHFNNIHTILNAEIDELLEVPGISHRSAILIRLINQLETKSLTDKLISQVSVVSPEEVVAFARKKIAFLADEAFMIIYLNSRSKIEHYEIINEGTVDRAVVYPRNVIRTALKQNAKSLIFIHNHPSGECTPSANDIVMTENLAQAAEAVEIHVMDHIIVSKTDYFSFREENLL